MTVGLSHEKPQMSVLHNTRRVWRGHLRDKYNFIESYPFTADTGVLYEEHTSHLLYANTHIRAVSDSPDIQHPQTRQPTDYLSAFVFFYRYLLLRATHISDKLATLFKCFPAVLVRKRIRIENVDLGLKRTERKRRCTDERRLFDNQDLKMKNFCF